MAQAQKNTDVTNEKPHYRVLEGGFFTPKGQMLSAGDMVKFTGEPNMNLEPMNAAATIKMEEFLMSRNLAAIAASEKKGKDSGVYLAPEVYTVRSYEEEMDALPKNERDSGRLMGINSQNDDTEVVFTSARNGNQYSDQPGAVYNGSTFQG